MQEQVGRLVPIPDSCGVLGGIGRTKLYELINDGQLTRVRIGSRAFITGESLENFLSAARRRCGVHGERRGGCWKVSEKMSRPGDENTETALKLLSRELTPTVTPLRPVGTQASNTSPMTKWELGPLPPWRQRSRPPAVCRSRS